MKSLINYFLILAGLTGQLLATILHHEKPELEQRKSQLLKVEEDHKIQISKLEDFLLEQLASSQVHTGCQKIWPPLLVQFTPTRPLYQLFLNFWQNKSKVGLLG